MSQKGLQSASQSQQRQGQAQPGQGPAARVRRRVQFQATHSLTPAATHTGQHSDTRQHNQHLRQQSGAPQQPVYAPESTRPRPTTNNGPIKSILKPTQKMQPSNEERILQEIRAALEQLRLSDQRRIEHDRRMIQLEADLRREVNWLKSRREEKQRRKQ